MDIPKHLHWNLLLLLLLAVLVHCDNKMVMPKVSRGGCVIPPAPTYVLKALSPRMCAFLCSQLRPCTAWSFRTQVCNTSDSLQNVRLTNETDCEAWSALGQLSLLAFWPMSNATRTRNVLSDSGYLDLQENIPMQYTDSAVNFTGQFGVSERFNVDQLASVCLKSFTLSVWVKVITKVPMPVIEGNTVSGSFFTRMWLYVEGSQIYFLVDPRGLVRFSGSMDAVSGFTHIAVAYDSQTALARISVNGTQQILSGSVTSGTSCVNFGNTVQIGAVTRLTAFFVGYMKCFTVSNSSLDDDGLALLRALCPILS